MASLGSIFVDLIARTGKYTQGLKQAADGTTKFERNVRQSLRGVGRGFDSIGASIKASLAALVSGAGLAALTKSALDAASRIKDLADTFNLTTGQFQAYEAGAQLASVSSEQFVTALSFLNKRISEGKTPYRNLDDALRGIAERMAKAKTASDITAIAVENFGAKGGQKLIPFLKDGEAGLIQFAKRARELGIILEEKTVKQAELFGDELETLAKVIKGNFQQAFLEQFVQQSGDIRSIYTDKGFRNGIQDIGAAFGKLASFVIGTVNAFNDAKIAIAGLFIAIGSKFNGADEEAALKKLIELRKQFSFNKPPLPVPDTNTKPGGGGLFDNEALEKRKKLLESINDSLNKQTVLISLENDNFGESEVLIQSLIRAKEIEIQLADAGVKLSEKERSIIQEKLDNLRVEASLNAELQAAEKERIKVAEELQKKQEEEQKRIEDSIQTIREDLAGELVDVLKGATSIADAFKNVAARIAEAVIQAELLKLITQSTGGTGGGLAGGGGILGFLGSLFSFDVGTPYVPYDMIAQVHQGEMIIPRNEANMIRNGQANSGVTMNIYTPDANSFRASDRQIARQLKTRVSMA